MREIKFRAWGRFGDTKKDEMIDNWQNTDYTEYVGFGGGGYFELMQYTGLKDKNGKEIYEGDIVEMGYFADEPTYTKGEVVFHEGAFLLKDKESCTHGMVPDWTVKLGNIYENPELLKPKEEDENEG